MANAHCTYYIFAFAISLALFSAACNRASTGSSSSQTTWSKSQSGGAGGRDGVQTAYFGAG